MESRLANKLFGILTDETERLPQRPSILDLGCGNGNLVRGLMDMGDAYGCDFKFKPGPEVAQLAASRRIRLIDGATYRLPFADSQFDVVVSYQVMEHVKDYPGTLAEIARVLKPGGYALHIFPARWSPIEPHVFVPLATVIQSKLWLSLWALLGVRSPSQDGMHWAAVAEANHAYLVASTNYLSGRQIMRHFACFFTSVCFVERAFLRNSETRKGQVLYRVSTLLPLIFFLYRTFRSRVVLAVR